MSPLSEAWQVKGMGFFGADLGVGVLDGIVAILQHKAGLPANHKVAPDNADICVDVHE